MAVSARGGSLLGLITIFSGYTLLVWGYSKLKVGASQNVAPALSLSDLVLPSHLATYVSAMGAYAEGGTASLVNPSTEQPQALAEATAQMKAACAGSGAGSAACKAAQQRVANIQSVNPSTGAVANSSSSGRTIKNNWAGDIVKFAKGL